jgi:hypothetical protein
VKEVFPGGLGTSDLRVLWHLLRLVVAKGWCNLLAGAEPSRAGVMLWTHTSQFWYEGRLTGSLLLKEAVSWGKGLTAVKESTLSNSQYLSTFKQEKKFLQLFWALGRLFVILDWGSECLTAKGFFQQYHLQYFRALTMLKSYHSAPGKGVPPVSFPPLGLHPLEVVVMGVSSVTA